MQMDVASTRENCDIPSSSYPIFDVPTFLPMTSRAQPRGEIRWNRTDGLILSKPLSRATPWDDPHSKMTATQLSLSNWPAELCTRAMTILLIADRAWWTRVGPRVRLFVGRGLKWSSRKCTIAFHRCTFTQRSASIRHCRHFVLGSII